MRHVKHLLIAILLLTAGAASAQVAYQRSALDIETASGRHHFTIELAISPEQQMQGLMFRRTLAPDAGMLFLYNDDHLIRMWLKNTLIPFDMGFIAADGRISNLPRRTALT